VLGVFGGVCLVGWWRMNTHGKPRGIGGG